MTCAPSAPIGHRDVLTIAVPMTLGYLTTPLVGLVATAVVGRLGDPVPIGGVALGSIVCDLVFTTFNFLRSGTTGLTAQAVGRGDGVEQRAVLLRALVFALVGSLVVTALARPILALGLAFLGGSDAVQAATRAYVEVRLWAAPLTLANYAVFGWFLGRGRAAVGLLLQTLLNAVNIALAVLLVVEAGRGVAGLALAGVVAEAVALAAGLGLVALGSRGARWPDLRRVFDRAAFAAMAGVNRDIMIRSFVLLAAFAFFSRQSAAQGDVVLAANAILEKFFLLTSYFLDGLAAAAETFVGRAVGARDRPAFDRAVGLTTRWAFALAALAGLACLLTGGTVIGWMTTAPAVTEAARHWLPWAAATPLVGVLAFQMDGVFIGATWSRDMARMMVASLVVFLALWALLFPSLGNDGLWLAFLGFLGARGLGLWAVMSRRAAAIGK